MSLITFLLRLEPNHPLNRDIEKMEHLAAVTHVVSDEFNLHPVDLLAWMYFESSLRPNAVSSKGAVGLGQFMPLRLKACHREGYNTETVTGQVLCTAHCLINSSRHCGDTTAGLHQYIGSGCNGSEKSGKVVNYRLYRIRRLRRKFAKEGVYKWILGSQGLGRSL